MNQNKLLKKRQMSSIHECDLNQCFHKVLHTKWLLPLCAVFGVIIGWLIYILFALPGWQTDAVLYLYITEDEETGYQMSVEEALTYTETILTSDSVLQNIAETLDLNFLTFQLRNMIKFEKETTTPVLTVLVTAETPEQSEKISNELLKAGSKQISTHYPTLLPAVLENASAKSAYQYQPDLLPYLGRGLLSGLLLPFIICYGFIFIKNTFASAEEVMKICRLPIAWEANIKNADSLNRFCGSYLITHSGIKNLSLICVEFRPEEEEIQKIVDCFKSFNVNLCLQIGDTSDPIFRKIAKRCDDAMMILKKNRTKRSSAWRCAADFQESGVTISCALLIEESKQKKPKALSIF